jgi:hypothetical protein
VTHLNLVNIDFAILLAQLFICLLHRVKRHHRIAQVLRCKRGALDIKRLLRELRQLRFVHAFLLQRAHCPLLDGLLLASAATLSVRAPPHS